MTDDVVRKPAADGLQPERTSLAWSRTSFAVLGNGALLLVREFDHFPGVLRLVPASLALVVALFVAGVGRWRQRLLHRRGHRALGDHRGRALRTRPDRGHRGHAAALSAAGDPVRYRRTGNATFKEFVCEVRMASSARARPLDRSHPLPLWAQIDADLRRRLGAGAFEDRFPGELELAAEYGVSRQTVRDALRRLRAEGVLGSGRGRGTWIRKPRLEQPLGALYSLFSSVEAMGLEQRSVVRALDVRTDDAVAARLGRAADTELVFLERLRLADGEPLALDRAWLPRSIAGPLLEADFSHSALYDELASLTGTRPTGGSEIISAAVPTASVRRLLDIPSGTAVMEVLRLGCLRAQPIEWRETLIRGDRFSVAAKWSAHEGYRMSVSGDRSGRT